MFPNAKCKHCLWMATLTGPAIRHVLHVCAATADNDNRMTGGLMQVFPNQPACPHIRYAKLNHTYNNGKFNKR